ncbi:MAG: hypothetical protein CVU42_16145 [Chloroflexi bacterium HGW-Chloroflexi-4]|jgi:hypothetical protein|nr:MAG: hypothetical protein CVU42_16145 [Chloroflexi bacterium HGW-Chloroflexi-4]
MKTAKERIFWGAVLVCILCGLYAFLALNGLSHQNNMQYTPQAAITIIPGGTIPTVDLGLLTSPTATATFNPEATGQSGIRTGLYVQITGTEGAGLNIRNNPGTSSESLFIANESEVFLVVGGPIEMDGYIWWQLNAPYDKSRQGWAAENYFNIIIP